MNESFPGGQGGDSHLRQTGQPPRWSGDGNWHCWGTVRTRIYIDLLRKKYKRNKGLQIDATCHSGTCEGPRGEGHFCVALCVLCFTFRMILLITVCLCSVSGFTDHMIFMILSWDEEESWNIFYLTKVYWFSHGKILQGIVQWEDKVFFFIKWWELQSCWPFLTTPKLRPVTTIRGTHWCSDFHWSFVVSQLWAEQSSQRHHVQLCWSLGWSRRTCVASEGWQ